MDDMILPQKKKKKGPHCQSLALLPKKKKKKKVSRTLSSELKINVQQLSSLPGPKGDRLVQTLPLQVIWRKPRNSLAPCSGLGHGAVSIPNHLPGGAAARG